MKIKCMHFGNIVGGKYYCNFEMSNRVYSIDGICPTLTARYDGKMSGFKIAVYEAKTNSRNRKKEKQQRYTMVSTKPYIR